jgi:hypothetical protein
MRDPIRPNGADVASISPKMEAAYQRRCLREGYWRSPIPSTWAGRAVARLIRKLTGDRRHV